MYGELNDQLMLVHSYHPLYPKMGMRLKWHPIFYIVYYSPMGPGQMLCTMMGIWCHMGWIHSYSPSHMDQCLLPKMDPLFASSPWDGRSPLFLKMEPRLLLQRQTFSSYAGPYARLHLTCYTPFLVLYISWLVYACHYIVVLRGCITFNLAFGCWE